MKRQILTTCVCLFALLSMAQTNFRQLSFEASIEAAKKENKLVFIDFYTDWCGPCRMMARDVFPQKELGEYMNEKFVNIKLNAEKEGRELAKFFEVNAYPTFIVVDTDKKVLFKKVGGAEANAFMSELERTINPDMSPERMKERYENGERSTRLVREYATYLLSQVRRNNDIFQQEATRIIHEYFEGLTDKQKLAKENLFVYTDFLQQMSDVQGQYLVKHFDEFPVEHKESLKSVIDNLFKLQAINLLYGECAMNESEYAQFKKMVNEMGVNGNNWYNPMFQLIECLQQKDYHIFLSLCEEIYPTLDESQQLTIIGGMSSIIRTDDKQIKKRASQFIRTRLPEMTLGQLMNVVYPLSVLEKDL